VGEPLKRNVRLLSRDMGMRRVGSLAIGFLAIVFSLPLLAAVQNLVFSPLDGGPLDYRPRQEAAAESPDGALSVRVLRQRDRSYSCCAGARVFVRVYGRDGSLRYEKLIGSDGAWSELDAKYRIIFDADKIQVLRYECRAGCANPNFVISMAELR